jgi:threonylcarbamoyladenosine tRNA methylthiotransferase CDKAL1
VFVEVFGCSANQADAEIASGLLIEAGHTVLDDPKGADSAVVLTCTVKTPTENRVLKRIRELYSTGVPLIVAGCMPKAQRCLVERAAPNACMLGPDDLPCVVEAVEASIRGCRVVETSGGPYERTCLPRSRLNPVIHIAPISSGCLGECSYCIVRHARGRLHSFPLEGIVEDTRRAMEGGCREVWVTAEDTAAYRWEGVRLPELLEALCGIEGRFRIRVGMMTPNQAEGVLSDLVKAFRSEKIFKFLHVPVQSGNDDVLQRMNRRYTVDDFRTLVGRFREAFPSVSLSTDVICGFPGETDEQFNDSLRLVEEVTPDVLNISRFWPRPGTMAAEMDGQLHGRDTKRRSRAMSELWKNISEEKNRSWIGWQGEIVVDEFGSDGSVVGRNYAYKPIVIPDVSAPGEFVEATVVGATRGYLIGNIVCAV